MEDDKFASLQGNDLKIRDLRDKVIQGEYNQFYFVRNNLLFRSIVENGHKFEVRVIPESLRDVVTKLLAHDCEFISTNQCDISFQMLKDMLCSAPILKYPDTTKPYTLYTEASKYRWAGVLTQSHTSVVDEKSITMDYPVSYVSGLFRGSQLNWAALTKEAYTIYMSIKKSIFYLTGHEITLRSDHLPLKKFLRKMTLNNMVNNWSTEIQSFNINFVHISGKANVLADMLSRLIDTDPDLQQQPELEGHEFGKYCFETLPKARGSTSEVKNRW